MTGYRARRAAGVEKPGKGSGMRRLALLVAPVLLTGCVTVVVPTATPAPTTALLSEGCAAALGELYGKLLVIDTGLDDGSLSQATFRQQQEDAFNAAVKIAPDQLDARCRADGFDPLKGVLLAYAGASDEWWNSGMEQTFAQTHAELAKVIAIWPS